ncbi:aspartic proteinase nepenthesin-2-like [Chenopodium quinoa]|uniref:aspartic proteinase nepenthesin-2-like n=1 Tax=Chenopodium quinoa TaxID=63459 RepID=UPI000B773049|nr:aspartic proteinase nepenthesin-2-like [Chenopodium quinoa]
MPLIPPLSPRSPFYTHVLEANNILSPKTNITLNNENHYMTWLLSVSPNEAGEVEFKNTEGHYVTYMYMGTPDPEQLAYVTFDTRSGLTWFQCERHDASKYPWFNRTKSQSYNMIWCDDEQKCITSKIIKGCEDCEGRGRIPCTFSVRYEDGGQAKGVMGIKNTVFKIRQEKYLINFRFGRSLENNLKGMGIIGGGNNVYSLPNQLYTDDPRFSYCISRDQTQINFVEFGPDANLIGQAYNMTKNPHTEFYYLDVRGITMDFECLDMAEDVFKMSEYGTQGFIIDSGSTIT